MYPGNQKGGTTEHKFLSQILASAETQQISEPHSVSGSAAAWQKLKTGQEINGEGMVGGRGKHSYCTIAATLLWTRMSRGMISHYVTLWCHLPRQHHPLIHFCRNTMNCSDIWYTIWHFLIVHISRSVVPFLTSSGTTGYLIFSTEDWIWNLLHANHCGLPHLWSFFSRHTYKKIHHKEN